MPNINQIGTDIDVEQLEDDELLMAHMALHAYYKEFRMGRGKDGWTLEEVVQMHDEIRQTIEDRDEIDHDYISGLDNESVDAVQKLDIEMGHREDMAKEWVDDLLQSESVSKHVQQNPPNADWYTKAVDFLEQEDPTINLTEHVTFAAQSFETFDEGIQDWIKQAAGNEVGAVGYHFNEDTETGALFLKQEGEYAVYVDNTELETTESQTEALEMYQGAVRYIQDGGRCQYVVNELTQEANWEVIQTPEELELASPDTELEGEFTLEEFRQEFDYDEEESWDEFSEEDRKEITQRFTISASGSPAEEFSDLHAPRVTSDGQMVLQAVVETKQANSGISGEIDIPGNIRDDVESNLNGIIEQFSEEYGTSGPDTITLEQGELIPDVDDDHRWYVWEQDEARRWMDSEGIDYGEPELRGTFIQFPVNDQDDYGIIKNEWFGPSWAPHFFIQELDRKPMLVTLGMEDEESRQGDIISIQFQVEEPPEFNIGQMEVVDADMDWYWYQWNEPEVETWLHDRELAVMEQEEDDQFIRAVVQEPDQFEKLDRSWQGSRSKPTDATTLAGGEKPRRVVYGETEDGEKVVQAVEFLKDNPVEQALHQMERLPPVQRD